MKKTMLVNNDKEIAKMEMETGYITYRTLADKVGDMVLCNNMRNRLYESLELVNGYNYDEDDMYDVEIFQWYIISNSGAEFLKSMTDEFVYYDSELDLYVWAITHFGASWNYVFTDIKAKSH